MDDTIVLTEYLIYYNIIAYQAVVCVCWVHVKVTVTQVYGTLAWFALVERFIAM